MNTTFDFELPLAFDEAVERVTAELQTEGFGVLTRADLHEAFEEKLGETFRPYVILGACNPPLAFRALNAHPEVGLFLPCNVTVEAAGEGASRVRILDPDLIMGQEEFGEDPVMREIAADAKARLERASAAMRG
jgi:uncharacterized protein (DUF302 family)